MEQRTCRGIRKFKNMFGSRALQNAIPVFTKTGTLTSEDVILEMRGVCVKEPESAMCKALSEMDMKHAIAFSDLTIKRKRQDRFNLLKAVVDLARSGSFQKYDHHLFKAARGRRQEYAIRIAALPNDLQMLPLRILEDVSGGRASYQNVQVTLLEMECEKANRETK